MPPGTRAWPCCRWWGGKHTNLLFNLVFLNTVYRALVLLAVPVCSCDSYPKNPQAVYEGKTKTVTKPDTVGQFLQLALTDSAQLTHVKGLFFTGSEGHLYEKTTALREIEMNGPLVNVEYFNGKIPQDIDPMTFHALDGWYAKDGHAAYYYRPTSGGMLILKLNGADSKSFEVLNGSYRFATDRTHVFGDGQLLEGLNPKHLKFMRSKTGEILSVENSQH